MRDNDIIEALECCLAKDLVNDRCEECPNFFMGTRCMDSMLKDALDLINRQKAEIDYWKSKAFDGCMEREQICKSAKSEAIKEFAERLKEFAIFVGVSDGYGIEAYTKAVTVIEIDRIVKEMTEEQK